jgi:hypothetical protein
MRKSAINPELELGLKNSLRTIERARRRLDHATASQTTCADLVDRIDMCNVLLFEISAVTQSIGGLFTGFAPDSSRLTRN